MNKIFFSFLLILGLGLPTIAHAHPPAHKHNFHQKHHKYDKVWVPGHYTKNGVWMRGHWESKMANADKRVIWVSGHWKAGRWVSGRWTVIGRL